MLAFRHNMDEGEKIFPPASKRGGYPIKESSSPPLEWSRDGVNSDSRTKLSFPHTQAAKKLGSTPVLTGEILDSTRHFRGDGVF